MGNTGRVLERADGTGSAHPVAGELEGGDVEHDVEPGTRPRPGLREVERGDGEARAEGERPEGGEEHRGEAGEGRRPAEPVDEVVEGVGGEHARDERRRGDREVVVEGVGEGVVDVLYGRGARGARPLPRTAR
ncbi:predicted protein [Streptomyces sp. SPB78]|nr:predicted protein [Streptomyces sp. SPB78]